VGALARLLAGILRARGKRMTLRTHTHARYREIGRHTESELWRDVAPHLPADVVMMSKCTPQDFFGSAYPNNPAIGRFPANPEVVEFTLAREILGGTWTPNLTPQDYIRRIQYARDRGCAGLVGRVHSPISFDDGARVVLDHPNAFNIFCFSQLAWNPECDLDQLWESWASQRYPKVTATDIRTVLEPTEPAANKIYLTLGTYAVNYANRIPTPPYVEQMLLCLSLAKWDMTWADTHKRIQDRDATVVHDVVREKVEGIRLALDARRKSRMMGEGLVLEDALKIKLGLDRLVEAGLLFARVNELFFRGRSIEAGKDTRIDRFVHAAESMMRRARQIRDRWGYDAWPCGTQIYRGNTAVEQFLCEAYRPLIYRWLGQPVPCRILPPHNGGEIGGTTPLWPEGNLEHFWRMLLALAPTPGQQGAPEDEFEIEVPSCLEAVHLSGRHMTFVGDAGELVVPLHHPLAPVTLRPGVHTVRCVGVVPYRNWVTQIEICQSAAPVADHLVGAGQ